MQIEDWSNSALLSNPPKAQWQLDFKKDNKNKKCNNNRQS
jgi:hypothetical protein